MQKVSEVYKNLYHYTTWEGLQGILETQTLWATHYKFLNDYSEIILFKDKLSSWIHPYVLEGYKNLIKHKPGVKKKIKVKTYKRKGKKVKGYDRKRRALGKKIKYKTAGKFQIAHDEKGNIRGSKIVPLRKKTQKPKKTSRKRQIKKLDQEYLRGHLGFDTWIKQRKQELNLK